MAANGDKETQRKIEAYGAIQGAKECLDSLAALTVLRLKAAVGGGEELTPTYWEGFFEAMPWGRNTGETPQVLPEGLEVALNELIFKQLGEVWKKLDEAEAGFGEDAKEGWRSRYKKQKGEAG